MMTNPENCLVCPICDTVHTLPHAGAVDRWRCIQCGYVLSLGQPEAIARVLGLSLTSLILMSIVLFAPFLNLQAGPFGSNATVVDVVLSLGDGIMMPLAISVLVFIVGLPALCAGLLVYVLTPLILGRPNAAHAEAALRWVFFLKPWAMAEIFMVGVAVALVKLAGMAQVEMGIAFWAFTLLVVVTAIKDQFMCRNTLWQAISTNRSA